MAEPVPGAQAGATGADGGDDDAQAALADAAQAGQQQQNLSPDEALAKAQADAARWKAHAQKHEGKWKTANDELTGLRQAQMSDQEKLESRATAAEARVADLEGAVLRNQLIIDFKLDADDAMLIGSGTAEDMTARAELLAKRMNGATGANDAGADGSGLQQQLSQGNAPGAAGTAGRILSGTRPVESLRPGALPATSAQPKDKNAMFREMINQS
jgi:hypothetical protein